MYVLQMSGKGMNNKYNSKTLDGLVDVDANTITADKIDTEELYIDGKKFFDTGSWRPTFYFDDSDNGNDTNYLAYYTPRLGSYTLLGNEVSISFTVCGEVRTESIRSMYAYVGGLPYQALENFSYGGFLSPNDSTPPSSERGGCWFSLGVPDPKISGTIYSQGTIVQGADGSGNPLGAPHVCTGYEISLWGEIQFDVPVPEFGELPVYCKGLVHNAFYNHAAPSSVFFKAGGTLTYRTNGKKNPNINGPGPWDP